MSDNYTLNAGQLLEILSRYPPEQPIQFYFLKNHELQSCDIENIMDTADQIEITIEQHQSEVESQKDIEAMNRENQHELDNGA